MNPKVQIDSVLLAQLIAHVRAYADIMGDWAFEDTHHGKIDDARRYRNLEASALIDLKAAEKLLPLLPPPGEVKPR